MSKPRSVIVCGGGIVGLCSAYYLAREGFRVTLLERNAEGAASCAHGSAGHVSPSRALTLAASGMFGQGLTGLVNPRSPCYVQPRLDGELMRWAWLCARHGTTRHARRAAPLLRDLCRGGRRLYLELSELTGQAFEVRTEGLLNLCRTAQQLDHETRGLAALADELGMEARVLTPQQVAALEPGVRMEVAGAVYFPDDAHLSPQKFMPAMTALLQDMGVRFHWNTTIYGWRAEGGRVAGVQTTAGDLMADEYVLATGSWSPATVAGLGLRLPMQPGKGYSLTLEKPRFTLTKPLRLAERRVAVTPMGDRLRFAGTLEINGHNDVVRPERIAQIRAAARSYFPDFTAQDFAGVQPWFGYRPVSPDGLPYIGRFRAHANLTAACGHAMLGVALAPITGQLVAELLAGRRPSLDLRWLQPDRFS